MSKNNEHEVFNEKDTNEVFSFSERENLKQIPDENYVFNAEENASQLGSDLNKESSGVEENDIGDKKKKDRRQDDRQDRQDNNNNNQSSSSSSSSSSASAGGSSSVAASTGGVVSAVASTAVVAVVMVVGGGLVMSEMYKKPEICEFSEVYVDDNSVHYMLKIGTDEESIYSEGEKDKTDAVIEISCPDINYHEDTKIEEFGIFVGEFNNLEYDTTYILNVYRPTMLGASKEYILEEGYSITTPKKEEIPPEPEIVYAEEIVLGEHYIEVTVGEIFVIEATVLPENTTDKTIEWSTNKSDLISIDVGTFTALAAGTATIYASCGPYAHTLCDVVITEEVVEIPTENIILDENTMEIEIGKEYQLGYTALPENHTDTITFESDDPLSISVSQTGVLYASESGLTATITVSAGDVYATCVVTSVPKVVHVETVHITNFDMEDIESVELEVGHSEDIYFYCDPFSSTQIVDFEIEDESIAIITGDVTASSRTKIYAVNPGETKLIARSHTDPEIYDEITIITTGEAVHTQDMVVYPEELNLIVGDTGNISPQINPNNSTDPIIYKSGNTEIVRVSNNGVVTAVGVGDTTIRVESGDVVGYCYISVTNGETPGSPDEIILDKNSATGALNELITVEAMMYPSSSEFINHGLMWTCEETSIVEWSTYGTETENDHLSVRGVEVGTVIFTCFYDENDNEQFDTGEVHATVTVTITEEAEVEGPDEVVLDNTSIVIPVDELASTPVVASLYPNAEYEGTLRWQEGENSNIVGYNVTTQNRNNDTINITGLAEGQTSFTCYFDTNDNEMFDTGEVGTSLVVTVQAPASRPEGLSRYDVYFDGSTDSDSNFYWLTLEFDLDVDMSELTDTTRFTLYTYNNNGVHMVIPLTSSTCEALPGYVSVALTKSIFDEYVRNTPNFQINGFKGEYEVLLIEGNSLVDNNLTRLDGLPIFTESDGKLVYTVATFNDSLELASYPKYVLQISGDDIEINENIVIGNPNNTDILYSSLSGKTVDITLKGVNGFEERLLLETEYTFS